MEEQRGDHAARARASIALARFAGCRRADGPCLERYAEITKGLGAIASPWWGRARCGMLAERTRFAAAYRELFGVDANVISGDDEARLTYRGALCGLSVPAGSDPEGGSIVFDIGGGSTEIVRGIPSDASGITYARSFDIGSVRLTERYVQSDPPSAPEILALKNAANDALRDLPLRSTRRGAGRDRRNGDDISCRSARLDELRRCAGSRSHHDDRRARGGRGAFGECDSRGASANRGDGAEARGRHRRRRPHRRSSCFRSSTPR